MFLLVATGFVEALKPAHNVADVYLVWSVAVMNAIILARLQWWLLGFRDRVRREITAKTYVLISCVGFSYMAFGDWLSAIYYFNMADIALVSMALYDFCVTITGNKTGKVSE